MINSLIRACCDVEPDDLSDIWTHRLFIVAMWVTGIDCNYLHLVVHRGARGDFAMGDRARTA
jgi:hypothetical protein